MLPISSITIEVDGPKNRALYFTPLGRRFRGRLIFHRDSEPMARLAGADWPSEGLPGQMLALDPNTGEGSIIEPLHNQPAIAQKLSQRGYRIDSPLTSVGKVDVPTWLHWMRRAVDSGTARVIQGELPATIQGQPRLDFALGIRRDPQAERVDRLIDLIGELVRLPESQRKRVGSQLFQEDPR